MPTKQDDLIHACARAIQGIEEVRANAVRLAQLEQQIKDAENTLVGLKGQIEQGKKLAAQVQELNVQARQKRAELAALEATIADKNAEHGKIEMDMRDLRRRVTGDPTHA